MSVYNRNMKHVDAIEFDFDKFTSYVIIDIYIYCDDFIKHPCSNNCPLSDKCPPQINC